jgi:NAD(P)-dependent dehydrogenase (short-subunit alcohol dehydrogenase family)
MRPIDETTVLITGATDGLGRALAERLAAGGAHLFLHGRDPGRLAAAAAAAQEAGAGAVRTFQADLASLEQVRGLAREVRDATDGLQVLVNNAGIGSGRPDGVTRQESADGYELRFAVNHLAHFLLTLELLGLLRRSAPARVVHVASLGQAPVDFADVMLEHDYSGGRAYAQSKLAQISAGFELASRLPAAEVTVNSLHPSTYMPTKMVLEEVGHSIDTLEAGVDATWRLVAAPELDGVTGRFFDRTREAEPDPQALDPSARRRLWDLSVRLTGAPDVG